MGQSATSKLKPLQLQTQATKKGFATFKIPVSFQLLTIASIYE